MWAVKCIVSWLESPETNYIFVLLFLANTNLLVGSMMIYGIFNSNLMIYVILIIAY